jgi:hypothetical protein
MFLYSFSQNQNCFTPLNMRITFFYVRRAKEDRVIACHFAQPKICFTLSHSAGAAQVVVRLALRPEGRG